MKSVIAVRHVHFEDLGTLEPVLRELDYDIQYIDAPTADLTQIDPLSPDLFVVLGGPIGAFDDDIYPFITDELNLISRRLQARRPVLGICLGAQLMARALGARVYSMEIKEIGFAPVELSEQGRSSPLAGLRNTKVLHWHGDQFEIPSGAINLASTSGCPNQAFSVGEFALALQFHVEAEPGTLERWLVGHASELAQAGIDPRTLREQAASSRNTITRAAREVLEAWLHNGS